VPIASIFLSVIESAVQQRFFSFPLLRPLIFIDHHLTLLVRLFLLGLPAMPAPLDARTRPLPHCPPLASVFECPLSAPSGAEGCLRNVVLVLASDGKYHAGSSRWSASIGRSASRMLSSSCFTPVTYPRRCIISCTKPVYCVSAVFPSRNDRRTPLAHSAKATTSQCGHESRGKYLVLVATYCLLLRIDLHNPCVITGKHAKFVTDLPQIRIVD